MRYIKSTPYEVEYIEEKKYEHSVWLVGTDSHGILLCERVCTLKEIENGEAFSLTGRQVEMCKPDAYECMNWYVDDTFCYDRKKRMYADFLEQHPEVVFLTLDELYEMGIEFKPVTLSGVISKTYYQPTADRNGWPTVGENGIHIQTTFDDDGQIDRDNYLYYTISKYGVQNKKEHRIFAERIYVSSTREERGILDVNSARLIAFRNANLLFLSEEAYNENDWECNNTDGYLAVFFRKLVEGVDTYCITLYLSRNDRVKKIRVKPHK